MSSLPTHSTSGSLSASTGPVSQSNGEAALANSLTRGPRPSLPAWVSGNGSNLDCSNKSDLNGSKGNEEVSRLSVDEPVSLLSESSGGIRSPITTDESLIEHLEQRLLERETELQELQVGKSFSSHQRMSSTLGSYKAVSAIPQVSFEDKEAETCQLFDDRQRYCTEEMEGLKQRCSTKLRQVSQIAAKAQHTLQLQVRQLQVSVAPPKSTHCTSTRALFLSIYCRLFNKETVCAGGQREASRRHLQAQPREGSRRAQTEVLRNTENTSGANT